MTTNQTIMDVVCAPLCGASPKGGWSEEIKPEDSVHTILAIHTEQGLTGYGSAFTSGALVEASLGQLKPLLVGRNALEVGKLIETLHQNTFGSLQEAPRPHHHQAGDLGRRLEMAKRPIWFIPKHQ